LLSSRSAPFLAARFLGDNDYIEPNFARFRKFVFGLKQASFAKQKSAKPHPEDAKPGMSTLAAHPAGRFAKRGF
jgi:hypothetical protein